MLVKYSRWVEPDLEEIAAYIAKHNPDRAISFVAELREEMVRVGANPLIYRLHPETAPEMRQAVYGRYLILFRVVDDTVLVERVIHGARDIPTQFRHPS
jgi:toxin ParE1/3/4